MRCIVFLSHNPSDYLSRSTLIKRPLKRSMEGGGENEKCCSLLSPVQLEVVPLRYVIAD